MRAGTDVDIGVIAEATTTKALYFPSGVFSAASPPASQILLWSAADEKKRSVVVSVSRPTDDPPAGANPILFAALGGRGSGELACKYRTATTWDKLRFIPGVSLTALVAIVTLVASGLTAYETFAGSLQSSASKSLVGFAAAVLLVNSLLALLTAISQWQKLGS